MTNEEGIRKHKALKQSYQTLFNSVIGKKVLKDLILKCGITRGHWNGKRDAAGVVYMEGQRSVALYIMEQLTKDPEVWAKQMMEAENDGDY